MNRVADELRLARTEIREGRFQRSMAVITTFAAIVSGFEAYTQHRRGAFRQGPLGGALMWTPVWLTPPVVASAGAALVSETAAHRLLPLSAVASLIDGIAGFVFHIQGIARRPGGFGLGRYNIVMGPPVFAPLLMGITGLLGLLASMLRRETADKAIVEAEAAVAAVLPAARPDDPLSAIEFAVSHGRFQKIMAAATATLAALAGGEAYFEHLRGSYNAAVMWTPVLLTPPMMAAAIASVPSERVARRVLPWASAAVFADGALGFLLHVRGLFRMPGRMGNVSFNVTYGPPLFAPLLFCATGLLGMIAALLGRRKG